MAHLRTDPAVAEVALDVVPGARTVLLVARPGVSVDRLRGVVPDERHAFGDEISASRQGLPRRELVVPVAYDGADLAEVAEPDRAEARGGRGGAHGDAVAGGVRGVRAGVRLPRRR
nr:carboxyltransferase domain-containing protein [Nocardioides convexus]